MQLCCSPEVIEFCPERMEDLLPFWQLLAVLIKVYLGGLPISPNGVLWRTIKHHWWADHEHFPSGLNYACITVLLENHVLVLGNGCLTYPGYLRSGWFKSIALFLDVIVIFTSSYPKILSLKLLFMLRNYTVKTKRFFVLINYHVGKW